MVRIEQSVLSLQVQFLMISTVPVVHFRGTLWCVFAAGTSLHVSGLSVTRWYCAVLSPFRPKLQTLFYWTVSSLESLKLLSLTLLT